MASRGTHAAQWYYYLSNDPFRRLPDGWYEYEISLNRTVEQLFHNHRAAAASAYGSRALIPSVAISGYRYELDFLRMTQINTATQKERPICRTTNGMPPPQPPGHAMVPSAPYAVALPVAAAVRVPVAVPVQVAAPRTFFKRPRRSAQAEVTGTITYVAPEKLQEIHVKDDNVFDDVAPPPGKPTARHGDEKKQDNQDDDDDCAICLDTIWNGERVVSLKACQHKFHYKCIHDCLTQSSAKCPLCSKSVHHEAPTAKGKGPSGTMTVYVDPHTQCAGFPNANGTLALNYRLQGGVQKEYHQNPGQYFSGDSRKAYLPNNQQGQDLCERLKYAFAHGLTFMVGTSLTTGQANVVTWASLHHKTSSGPGPFGYPDDTYIGRSNDELSNAGVPNAAQCRQWLDENA